MKIEKDEIYVINQPKHTLLSIAIVGNEFPIDDNIHNNISKLNEVSDIIFVFSDRYFPKSKTINKDKFSSLYNVCGWISSKNNLANTIFKVLNYSIEIFEKHISYSIFNLSDFKNINDNLISYLSNLNYSKVSYPVLKIRQLTSKEYYEIYKKDRKFYKLFKKSNDFTNKYCSYTSDSRIMFFRKSTIKLLLQYIKDLNKNYIESFDINDCRYIFASLLKYLGFSIIDSNIEDLEINKV